ncbi:MAG: metalloregulator ArsR/SmtB family transcription factor [Pyrinomonadaceae bacterium]
MSESTLSDLENLFMALSDKTRLRLLALMADGEVSVGYLADTLDESQPKISRHLAYLRGAGLVSTRRDGKWIYYGIETDSAEVAAVLGLALSTMNGKLVDADNYRIQRVAPDVFVDPNIDDWAPNELEVYLL